MEKGDRQADERGTRECCYKLAAVVGVDPRPFSLRELYWMVVAKRRADWEQTSWLSAVIANTALKKRGQRPFQPHEFNPMAKQMPKRRMSSQETKSTLRAMAGVRLKDE